MDQYNLVVFESYSILAPITVASFWILTVIIVSNQDMVLQEFHKKEKKFMVSNNMRQQQWKLEV